MLRRRHLEANGKPQPDGRPLYRYRLTQEEFDELEKLLKTWVTHLNRRASFALIAGRLSGFPALFVLYAAEWWRRRYKGGHWAWEPILKEIGADPSEWTPQQRSICVSKGLKEWGLRPREDGGLRYLGSVAVQGGLPMQLLAQARGRVGLVLKRVLQLAADTPVTQSDLLEWVKSLAHQLPQTFRQAAVFSLLADIAWCVLELKAEANLKSSTSAIEQLDRHIPNWRERFPLAIDDDQARGLVEQLMRDVAAVGGKKAAPLVRVIREIEAEVQGEWHLSSRLELPVSLTAQQLARLFDLSVDELPRMLELALTAGDYTATTNLRRLAGTENYRIERRPWEVLGDDATTDHILHLRCADGREWKTMCLLGEALEEDLPWVFSAQDGLFLRQGGGAVSAPEVYILIPSQWRAEEGEHIRDVGMCGMRRVLHVRRAITLKNETGEECQIKVTQAGTSDESYIWYGERLWLDFQSPRLAFKGRPRLYRINQDGTSHPLGMAAFSHEFGPVAARYPHSGPLQYRSRLLLLPPDAHLELEGLDANSGIIHLHNWRAIHVKALEPDIQQNLRKDDSTLHLTVTSLGQRTPHRLKLEVLWRQGQCRLFVPFPAKGVRAFNSQGEELHQNACVPVQKLAGVRLQVLTGTQSATIELCNDSQKMIRRIQAAHGSLSLELRLLDFHTDIQHLLACDDALDAQVKVLVHIGGEICFVIRVARYAAQMLRDATKIKLDHVAGFAVNELAQLQVLALRLERPGDEAVLLESDASCGVPTGVWDFAPSKREPGNWLIYPGKNASIPFRPMLWSVAGEIVSESPLTRAISLADQQSRENELDHVISVIAADFMDPCWIDVERLVGQIGHLPLPTLDLWRRFARSPEAMAALALRFSSMSMEFIDRFDQELPFVWETIPFHAWRGAIEGLKRQCIQTFGETTGERVFAIHLESRVQDLRARHGALAYLLGLSCAGHLADANQDVRGVQALGGIATDKLFRGEDSDLMALRRRHAEDEWPLGFNDILSHAKTNKQIRTYLYPEALGYCDGVINLPLLLAAQAATGQTSNWFGNSQYIQVLRNHYAFDPEWFEDAYNLTIARCLVDGLIKLSAL